MKKELVIIIWSFTIGFFCGFMLMVMNEWTIEEFLDKFKPETVVKYRLISTTGEILCQGIAKKRDCDEYFFPWMNQTMLDRCPNCHYEFNYKLNILNDTIYREFSNKKTPYFILGQNSLKIYYLNSSIFNLVEFLNSATLKYTEIQDMLTKKKKRVPSIVFDGSKLE